MTEPSAEEEKKLMAVHVGISGFPYGSAAINKCLAVYGSLHRRNVDFLLINNRAVHASTIPADIKSSGTVDGMRYTYTSPSPYRSPSFFSRNLAAFTGRLREFHLLYKLGRAKQIDVLFYYPTNGSFFELLFYRWFSRIFRFPVIAHYVEYRTAFSEDMNAFQRLKHRLFDRYFMRYVDAVLPISEYLISHLKKRNYKGPYLKVPPLTDFNAFTDVSDPAPEPYFLYVGSAAYLSAIAFVTGAFDKSRNVRYALYLVINGTPEQMKKVKAVIDSARKKNRIQIFSRLTYTELIEKYLQAKGLLIPLTDNITDVARFPQKISEYLASGNPVVTTHCGEIPYYFKDRENALVANGYDVDEFAEKLNFIADHPQEAAIIGKKGHDTGKKFFDLNSYGPDLEKLIFSLLKTQP